MYEIMKSSQADNETNKLKDKLSEFKQVVEKGPQDDKTKAAIQEFLDTVSNLEAQVEEILEVFK